MSIIRAVQLYDTTLRKMLADVRYYLLNTDLSVKEIAEELGFSKLSFFGKFCRRAFGYSPNDFRKQILSR